MKTLALLGIGLSLTFTSCSRHSTGTVAADPNAVPYSTTRSRITPANTGDNTAGHQNRVNRANADR